MQPKNQNANLEAADSSSAKGRGNYAHVGNDQRQELRALIEEQGLSIRQAAKMLGMKYSTAKHIFAIYKKTGELDRKQTDVPADRERDIFLIKLGKEILRYKKLRQSSKSMPGNKY